MSLKVAIVTPEQEALDVTCDEVVVPGLNGDIGILTGHVPLMTAIRAGVLTIVREGKKSFYAVSTGYAEVQDNRVIVLTGSCEAASEIDLAQAQQALAKAQAEMKDMGPAQDGYARIARQAARAQARIDTASQR